MTKFHAYFLITCYGSLFSCSLGWAQSLDRGIAIGGTGNDVAYDIALDGGGHSITVGYFTNSVDFDPGVGTQTLTSAGSGDIFVAKYSTSGLLQWAFSLGSTSFDQAYAVAVDPAENIYVVGRFEGTVDFDPDVGTLLLTSNGGTDGFIAKYDPAGALQWAFNLGAALNDEILDLYVLGTSRIFVTGFFQQTVDFDPLGTPANLTSNGGEDAFFALYDESGTYIWAQHVGGANQDRGAALVADKLGNLYLTGYFTGTIDLDPAGGGTVTANGSYSAFLARYDAFSNFNWGFSFGGPGFFGTEGNALALDNVGNLFITGRFQGLTDFDPSAGVANISSLGPMNAYVAKYTDTGKYVWAFRIGSFQGQQGMGLAVDVNQDLYVTGMLAGTADFDPSVNVKNLTSNGSGDIFLAKYGGISSQYIWAINMGSSSYNERGYAVATDGNFAYVSGFFGATADFDPVGGTAPFTSNGQGDFFFARYTSPVLPVTWQSFDATPQAAGIQLDWETGYELNNDRFSIERSIDGLLFEQLGEIPSKGDSDQGHAYTFWDHDPPTGHLFYRIRQVDLDGSFQYSATVSLTLGESSFQLSIYPNPAQDRVYYQIQGANHNVGNWEVSLYSPQGQRLYWQQNAVVNSGSIPLEALPAGMYFLELKAKEEILRQRLYKR